jgi:hypothetical protein
MQLSDRVKLILFSFTLVVGITLTVPYLAFGASHPAGRSGAFRSSGTHRHGGSSHRFQHTGFVGVDGPADQDIVIIQQFYPAPTLEPGQPAQKGIYVQPRWVDGGYGVQLLQPGYWLEPTSAARR